MSTMEKSVDQNIISNPENAVSKHGEIQTNVDILLEELAVDYSNYLNFDLTKEQTKYYESIEEMLTKLDEFCGLVDLIRSDTNLCLNATLPNIFGKCDELKDMFDRIDKLVQFVNIVKQNVTVMEEKVNQAERDLGDSIGSGIMKKLSSFISSKKSTEKKKVEYEEPIIFNTNDYFQRDSVSKTKVHVSHDPKLHPDAISLEKRTLTDDSILCDNS